MSALFYNLDRLLLAGAPIARWINGLLLFFGILAGFALFPGGWVTVALCSLLLIGFNWFRFRWRSREYLSFQEEARPTVEPTAMVPSDNVPLSASGYFSVEGKYGRFTWLQGYYRTFATREHAVICLVQPRRFLLTQWPEEEVGMWYIFFYPKDILDIRYGNVTFGRITQPALAIEHEIFIPKRGRFSRDRTLRKTFYLACPTEADTRRILADLLYDEHPTSDEGDETLTARHIPVKSPNGHVSTPLGATRRID